MKSLFKAIIYVLAAISSGVLFIYLMITYVSEDVMFIGFFIIVFLLFVWIVKNEIEDNDRIKEEEQRKALERMKEESKIERMLAEDEYYRIHPEEDGRFRNEDEQKAYRKELTYKIRKLNTI